MIRIVLAQKILKFILVLNLFTEDVNDKVIGDRISIPTICLPLVPILDSPLRLLADHFLTALGTGAIHAALTGNVRLFVFALGAYTIAAGARTRFIPATLTTSTLTVTTRTNFS